MSKIGIDDFIEDTQATADDVNSLPRVELRPRLAPEALYGLPGRIVSTFEPYTEADEAGTLGHLLAGIGNLIGPEAHARVLDDKHPARLSLVVVGRTAKARKGIAWSPVRAILTRVDPGWARERITTGLSSGEGLIAKVRDDGEQDRRLLVVESEFAVPLKRMQREANTLSAILRDAWDHGNLATLVKNNPLRATGAHVSVIGHITEEELRRYLTETERANGFANRFIFLYVDRSKLLPDGASVPEEVLAPLIQELRDAVTFSRQPREVRRDDEAREVWREVYPALSEGEPGLVGALTSRAEAQVLRMSLLYALLDKSTTIRVPHLRASPRERHRGDDSRGATHPGGDDSDRHLRAIQAEPISRGDSVRARCPPRDWACLRPGAAGGRSPGDYLGGSLVSGATLLSFVRRLECRRADLSFLRLFSYRASDQR
jgi:hypothetical protein